jgi:hypothetical protein
VNGTGGCVPGSADSDDVLSVRMRAKPLIEFPSKIGV